MTSWLWRHKSRWRSCTCLLGCLVTLFFIFEIRQLVLPVEHEQVVTAVVGTVSVEHIPHLEARARAGDSNSNMTATEAAQFSSEVTTVLHSDIWLSQAQVVYHSLSPIGGMAPVQCAFTNVFVDMNRVFIIARKGRAAEGAADLFDCCINYQYGNWYNTANCQRSVTLDFCRCFHQAKLAPAVATPWHLLHLPAAATTTSTAAAPSAAPAVQSDTKQSGTVTVTETDPPAVVVPHLRGITWLMHHWSEKHHPDHFGMKILELHGFVFNSRQNVSASTSWLSRMPSSSSIDNLLSFDYPLDNLTAYESFLLDMLFLQLGEAKPYMSAFTPKWRSLFLNDKFQLSTMRRLESLCIACCRPSSRQKARQARREVESSTNLENLKNLAKWTQKKWKGKKPREFVDLYDLPTAMTLTQICKAMFLNNSKWNNSFPPKTFHVEQAYMSPQYKNNIPFPYTSSTTGLHLSYEQYKELHAVEHQHLGITPCISTLRPSSHIRIAIVQRNEGVGKRQFANLNAMLASLQRITHEDSIEIIYLNSQTPPIVQASKFCNYHIMISPHSSQLANLMFSPRNISIIEIQNENYAEETFLRLGIRMNLHYQILRKGNRPYSVETNAAVRARHKKQAILTDNLVNIPNFECAVKNAVKHVKSSGYIL